MRNKKIDFLKKINLPIDKLADLQVPEDISTLVKSREGKEIMSWLDLSLGEKGGKGALRRIIVEAYDPVVAILDLAWSASEGNVTMAGVEAKYGEAIRALQELIDGQDGGKYRSGIERRQEIEKDILYLKKRVKQIGRFKESEIVTKTTRQMIMDQCYGLLDYLTQICADQFPASKIYVLISEIVSNLYSAKFSLADVKHLCDERKKIS